MRGCRRSWTRRGLSRATLCRQASVTQGGGRSRSFSLPITSASLRAEQVLRNACRGEKKVARGLDLLQQPPQIDIEQLSPPLAHLARDDHGLDVGAVHQRYDRARNLVERRHVERRS